MTIFVNSDINYCQFKEDFVFALMKCSYAAFGEQNKTDNDSKCQQVYKSQIFRLFLRWESQEQNIWLNIKVLLV